MYNKLYTKFESELKDRKLDRKIIFTFAIAFILYCIFIAILWKFNKSQVIPILSSVVFGLICFISCYLIIFNTVKRISKLKLKDLFLFKKVFKILASSQSTDVDIMLKILKELNINTESKLQKAIRHYQNVLLQKSNKGFSITNVLSITVSALGIFFSGIIYTKTEDLLFLIGTLSIIIIFVVSICILAKIIYKTTFYSLSEYALYERIEHALSEISISDKLISSTAQSTAQFGFTSHLL